MLEGMSSRRHGPSERVLIAGDENDLVLIREQLQALPRDAYGQVFIEALTDSLCAREALQEVTPGRVTVTWLVRGERESRIPELVFAERGEILARALVAWMGEWLPETGEGVPEPTLWIGGAQTASMFSARNAIDERMQVRRANELAASGAVRERPYI